MTTVLMTLAGGLLPLPSPNPTTAAVATACAVLAAWFFAETTGAMGDLGTHRAVERSRMALDGEPVGRLGA